MLHIDWKRKRVNIANLFRLHHGLAGVTAIIIGLWACWSDRHDWRDWFTGRDL